MTALDPHTDMILAAIVDGRTNLSGAWIADGIAFYRHKPDVLVQSPQPPIDDRTPAIAQKPPQRAKKGHPGASANGSGGAGNKRNRTAKRTRNATHKVLDYLSEHPSDMALSTDTLCMKLNKLRIKVGRSSVGKALGIARVNGHEE